MNHRSVWLARFRSACSGQQNFPLCSRRRSRCGPILNRARSVGQLTIDPWRIEPGQRGDRSFAGPASAEIRARACGFGFLMAGVLLVFEPAGVLGENWPAWRGPRGDGTSLETAVPIWWSESSNVLWRAEVPGLGHASPIVWEDRVFTVSALPERQERVLLCYERLRGRLLWQTSVLQAPLERKHRLNSHASSTPAADGDQVYAAFLDGDQMVVAAYDFSGAQRWLVRPGAFSSMHGFCSSPVLFEEKVIVNGDHDGDSYLVALDRRTGRVVWKTPRPNKTRSYCVPTLFRLGGRAQMVLSGDKSVASYDPRDGSRFWYLSGPTDQFVASMVYNAGADLLLVTGGFPDLHILALRHDGAGVLSGDEIVWRTTKGVSYVPSPISEGDYFLVASDGGIATCFAAKTGQIQWQERLGSEQHASLVSAQGRVYFLGDNGAMTVVRPGPVFDLLARNRLRDQFFASPAISQGRIYLRGETTLYCIGSEPALPY